ncbi:hypothetical protein MLD38_035028 [Melastoma candidum]|uniref:Uncharacterized protein n=1 Tax=Melastoma candidum TaxID=119954 RepID=A0ACB9MDJ5_9MYRT|nr:hypothetical protein MLD38_035028 [Melastoma candidum]
MGNCWGDHSEDFSRDSGRGKGEKPSGKSGRDRSGDDRRRHHRPELPKKVVGNRAEDGRGNGRKSEDRSWDRGGIKEEEEQQQQQALLPNLKMFTLAELRSATRNFRPDTVLGEGGFGRVFKGWVNETTLAPSKVGVGIPVAVKKSSPDSPQGLREWQAEVKFLGKYSHPNLVKLIGYCWEEKQFLLVYEYMSNRSLENHLFRRDVDPLDWETRLKVAIGAACGLAFLHNSEKSVIYRDFKASNILLDEEFNAKLSDFGLAKLGPADGDSHVSTRILGTYGYAAPEYVATGHLYINSDVYGFGVVLLELLSGLQAMDTSRPSKQHNLVEWVKPMLFDRRKIKKIVDPRLENRYPSKAAVQVAELILRCLEVDQRKRPSMENVLETLEHISKIKNTRGQSEQTTPQRSPLPQSPADHLHRHRSTPTHHAHGHRGGRDGSRPSKVKSM